MIIPINGIYPRIAGNAWMAPDATIIGDVEIGEKSSIWFQTLVRGDVHSIRIGRETNIQDGTIIHCTYKKASVTIGNRVTVGHKVMLHGCTVEDSCLIGMGSTIMDNAVIPHHCVVGAGSLVTEGATFEPYSLIIGSPAKFKRKLKEEEIKFLEQSADNYILYTSWYTGVGGKIP